MAELFVGGEGLRHGGPGRARDPVARGRARGATTRGIRDTSRQGRYHNGRFAELGAELGLTVAMDGARGWSATTLLGETVADYAG